MATITTYPGVYLAEDVTPNYSIFATATAVPAFAYRPGDSQMVHGDIHVFNSWPEFVSMHQDAIAGYHYAISLKLWFQNGGGKCYLVRSEYIEEAVAQYDDITLIVAAGTGSDIFSAITTLANSSNHRIFALLDGPDTKIGPADTVDTIMADYPETAFAAAFYPYGTSRGGNIVTPSAMAAAAIAQADNTQGVWKAPANIVINGVVSLKYPVSDDLQGRFNTAKPLNMFREEPDIGTISWGARTLEDSDNWRYISVRRLFNMVEMDIRRSLNKVVFETNGHPVWQRIKAALDNYLYSLWQQGALVGNTPKEAWFVEVGKGITMTEGDINQGKLIINLGLAAVRPAEFILLQFSQDIAQ